jgi:hypothetical protein
MKSGARSTEYGVWSTEEEEEEYKAAARKPTWPWHPWASADQMQHSARRGAEPEDVSASAVNRNREKESCGIGSKGRPEQQQLLEWGRGWKPERGLGPTSSLTAPRRRSGSRAPPRLAEYLSGAVQRRAAGTRRRPSNCAAYRDEALIRKLLDHREEVVDRLAIGGRIRGPHLKHGLTRDDEFVPLQMQVERGEANLKSAVLEGPVRGQEGRAPNARANLARQTLEGGRPHL